MVLSAMVAESQQQKLTVAGHLAFTLKEQRRENVYAQLFFSPLYIVQNLSPGNGTFYSG